MKRNLVPLLLLIAVSSWASDLRVPDRVVAGKGASLAITGSGTLYISGPGFAAKHDVNGGTFELKPEETRAAGQYIAVLKSSDGTVTRNFIIVPDETTRIVFQARPSRVPVAVPKVISGSAFVLDQYENLITRPTPVNFQLSVQGTTPLNKTEMSHDGVAFIQTNSSSRAGSAQFVATVGQDSVRRVVQQVASDPCGLRMHAQQVGRTIVVTTDPVRDCSGNPVPDGTLVTFTVQEHDGSRDQVDARIRKGIARAEFPDLKGGVITVASGVTLGNQIRVGGGE